MVGFALLLEEEDDRALRGQAQTRPADRGAQARGRAGDQGDVDAAVCDASTGEVVATHGREWVYSLT